MADKTKTPERDARLKSALRDNLKRRKAASRKATVVNEEKAQPDKSKT